jgi:hypothetical protein
MIDVTKITVPTYDDRAKAWVHPHGWTDAQRATWNGTQERLMAARRLADGLEAAAEAAKAAPDAVIAAAAAELAAEERRRARLERDAKDEVAWTKAVEAHGEAHVGRVYTESGSVILRTMTEVEVDAVRARANRVSNDALMKEGVEPSARMALADRQATAAYRAGLAEKARIHPDLVTFNRITAEWPDAWGDLYALRDKLNRGRAEAEGKGGAA